jgi:uncharacterized membrane protein YgcG
MTKLFKTCRPGWLRKTISTFTFVFLTTATLLISSLSPLAASAEDISDTTQTIEQNAPAGNVSPVEAITFYHSKINVNADNSVDVTEIIDYGTGPTAHHGIFRDIRPFSSQNKKMAIDVVSVTDEHGTSQLYSVSNVGGNIRIKIGDPNRTFEGSKIYVIAYHATHAVAQLKDKDEIYWNVTGNDWNFPIRRAMAEVVLPYGTASSEQACYFGPPQSTERCAPNNSNAPLNTTFSFEAPRELGAGEGLTVAVGFPKGVVAPYSGFSKVMDFINSYLSYIIGGLLPILVLIFSLRRWYKIGRDPHGTGIIVPQYDVPDDLAPMEVAGIVNENIKVSDISAEIIYLATRGYLKITQLDEKTLGVFKSTDYELTRLRDSSDIRNGFDRAILDNLLADPIGATKKLSDLKNIFYPTVSSAAAQSIQGLLPKGYYTNIKGLGGGAGRMVIAIFLAIWFSVFVGSLLTAAFFREHPVPIFVGIFLAVIIHGIVSYFYPAKSEKGVATKEYLLGLKMYLQIAEKDRLLFHNAPEKKPETFEKLLPFAMVLGVAAIWAKEFEGIYTTPPNWYSGPTDHMFNAVMLNNALSGFNTSAASTLSSMPSSSGSGGSGGGGFSGGGGGGGGGGSW